MMNKNIIKDIRQILIAEYLFLFILVFYLIYYYNNFIKEMEKNNEYKR